MQPKSKSPAPLARCEAEDIQLRKTANDNKRTSRRQQLSEISGALDFLAFWREDITNRATPDGDITIGDLYALPQDARAWLRAVGAFERWRSAA